MNGALVIGHPSNAASIAAQHHARHGLRGGRGPRTAPHRRGSGPCAACVARHGPRRRNLACGGGGRDRPALRPRRGRDAGRCPANAPVLLPVWPGAVPLVHGVRTLATGADRSLHRRPPARTVHLGGEQVASGARDRPDRGKRALRRQALPQGQPDRRGADDLVQRRRRLGRARGRLHADRLGARVPARPLVPAAAQRPAVAGGLRRRRRHRGRVQRAADGRLLCLRAGDRHLLARDPGAGGDVGDLRRFGRARAGRRHRVRHPGALLDRGDRLRAHSGARHAGRAGRHRPDARRDAGGGPVPPQPRAGLGAAGDRRPCGRRHGAGVTGGTLVGAQRPASLVRRAVQHAAYRPADPAEVDGIGGQHWLRLPRRLVLRVLAAGRAAGQAVCRAARADADGAGVAGRRVRHGGDERAGDRGGRRAVDNGVPCPGEHGFAADDRRGADRQRRQRDHRAADVRLQLRHVALPPARRGNPQRC